MKIANSKNLPKVYYGLHMSEGVAEYRPPGKDMLRVLVGEDAIRKMNPTFAGRPLFVGHKPDADVTNPDIIKTADGIVVDSFFNKADGKHWAKFMVWTPAAEEAVSKGLVLSNCYVGNSFGAGGRSKGVDYDKEILNGEFHHMALVGDPRYEDSQVLTPEEFKKYNIEKESELLKLANSKSPKGEKKPMFNLFKREKVENSTELEGVMVVLPKSKKEKMISQIINEADESEMKKSEPQMANGEHHVMVGEEKMTVNDLLEKHKAVCNELVELKKPKAEAGVLTDEEKKANELKAAEEKKANDKKAEDEKIANEAKAAADKKAEEEKVNNSLHFDALKDAPMTPITNENDVLDLPMDKVARGKSRYGSK